MAKRPANEQGGDTPAAKPESNWAARQRKARERREAWKATVKAKEEQWREQVDKHFSFLRTEYGFQIVKVDASSVWATVLVYQSATTAVRVSRSVEFECAEVELMRLVDGDIPPVVVFFLPDTVLNTTMLENVVLFRAPELRTHFFDMKGLSDEQLEATLAFLADSTRQYAEDVLRGDFSIFETIQEERREHARQHPPVVTIWKPASEAPAQAAQQADESKLTDDGLLVETRYYSVPSKAKGIPGKAKRTKPTRSASTSQTDNEGDERERVR